MWLALIFRRVYLKISLEIIFRETLEYKPELYVETSTQSMEFSGISSILVTNNPRKGYLLFGKAEFFKEIPENTCIISIGKIPKKYLLKNNAIFFPNSTNEEELYNKILEVFSLYEEWDNGLREAILKEKNLQSIVDISKKIFKNPILIHNPNFHVLALTKADYGVNLIEKDIDDIPIVATEILNQFKIDKEYQDTLEKKEPDFFSEDMFGFRVLYYNLWVDGQYYGRICISELNNPVFQCDKQLISYMADFVINSFLIGQNTLSERPRSLKTAMERIINGENVEIDFLEKALESFRWSLKDSYFLACLFTNKRDITTNTIKNTCQSIEAQFSKTCVFRYFNNIIVVVNSSLSGYSLNSFSKELSVFLRECLFKAGVSSIGNNFFDLRNYYLQAVSAYMIGIQKDESFWRFLFDDYVLEYIFHQATLEISKEFIAHPSLKVLKKYDIKNNGELYKTLKTYIENNMNLTKTSEELNIHRTTLLYRIERIEVLTKINLDDKKERFYIQLSYNLMD